ncbi:MAG: hypothetical protein AAI978_00030 [Candidatus Hodgkinia cicadicola]
MIVNVNKNQYKSSCFGLIKLKNTTVKAANIITGKVICFKCGNEIVYNALASRWLALIKPIGQNRENKILGAKFKRRKAYKRVLNTRRHSVLAQVAKVVIANGA